MSRAERFAERDWTWSVLHRSMPHPARMIDLDYIEYCPWCSTPLMLGEVARDVGQERKATTVLARLANMAGVPAYRIFIRADIVRAEVEFLYGEQTGIPELSPQQLSDLCDELCEVPDAVLRIACVAPARSKEERLTVAHFKQRLMALHERHERTCRAKRASA